MTKITDEQAEREQIEHVFSLGGGELEDKPLSFRHEIESDSKELKLDGISTRHYWYEGVPEYEDYYGSNKNETFWNHYLTIVSCCLYGAEPERIYIGDGVKVETWKRVASYSTSGERECPYRNWDPETREDHPDSFNNPRKVSQYESDHTEDGRCYMCEADLGEEHGYVYLGDGWSETIYERVRRHEVVVGNVETVYSGEDREEAKRKYEDYADLSNGSGSRASGESVVWMIDGEVEDEYEPPEPEDDEDERL